MKVSTDEALAALRRISFASQESFEAFCIVEEYLKQQQRDNIIPALLKVTHGTMHVNNRQDSR